MYFQVYASALFNIVISELYSLNEWRHRSNKTIYPSHRPHETGQVALARTASSQMLGFSAQPLWSMSRQSLPLQHVRLAMEPGYLKKTTSNCSEANWIKVRLYTARTRTRPTRTRTRPRLLSGFAIQIEHEPERGKPSTDYEAARLLLAWDIKLVIWNHGAGIIRHKEDHSFVFVRAMSTFCLLCHTVHDSSQFQKSLILPCPLYGPFFSKLH